MQLLKLHSKIKGQFLQNKQACRILLIPNMGTHYLGSGDWGLDYLKLESKICKIEVQYPKNGDWHVEYLMSLQIYVSIFQEPQYFGVYLNKRGNISISSTGFADMSTGLYKIEDKILDLKIYQDKFEMEFFNL